MIVLFELSSMVMMPFLIAKLRAGDNTHDRGDAFSNVCRVVPSCAFGHAVMFNSELVTWLSDKFFPYEEAVDTEVKFADLESTYPTDPWAL